MAIQLNKEQMIILRDLLESEVEYLTNEAIPAEEESDSIISVKDAANLRIALEQTQNMLDQIKRELR